MENFENFEIENIELIYGGKLISTDYTTDKGKVGRDSYDSESKMIKYLS